MDTRATISRVTLATENNLHHPSPNSDFDTQLTEMCQFLRAPDCVGNIDFDITPVKREREICTPVLYSRLTRPSRNCYRWRLWAAYQM